MFWIWLIIMVLMGLNVMLNFNKVSLGFFTSSIISFILTFITKLFIIHLCVFVIGGIVLSIILNKFLKK